MYELKRQGSIAVIQGDEPLNLDQLTIVKKLLDECFGKGTPRIVVNLQQTALIDSAGLELLLDTAERCQRFGGRLQLACANSLCRDILHVTKMDERLNMADDLVTALGSFAL